MLQIAKRTPAYRQTHNPAAHGGAREVLPGIACTKGGRDPRNGGARGAPQRPATLTHQFSELKTSLRCGIISYADRSRRGSSSLGPHLRFGRRSPICILNYVQSSWISPTVRPVNRQSPFLNTLIKRESTILIKRLINIHKKAMRITHISWIFFYGR